MPSRVQATMLASRRALVVLGRRLAPVLACASVWAGCIGAAPQGPRPLRVEAEAWTALAPAEHAPRTAVVIVPPSRWGDPSRLPAVAAQLDGAPRHLVFAGREVSAVPVGAAGLTEALHGDPIGLVAFDYASGGAGAWFTAATARRLDGTAAAPIDLAATLDDARQRWETYRDAQSAAMTAALAAAGDATPGRPLGPEQERQEESLAPTWSDGHLEVLWIQRRTRSSELVSGGHIGCSKTYRLGEPAPQVQMAPCAPHYIEPTFLRRSYSTELALIIVYDRQGRLVETRPLPPRPLSGPAPTETHQRG